MKYTNNILGVHYQKLKIRTVEKDLRTTEWGGGQVKWLLQPVLSENPCSPNGIP